MIVGQDSKGNAIMPKLDLANKRNTLDKKSIILAEDIPYDLEDGTLIKEFMKSAKIYDVPHLSSRDLKRILIDISGQYNETFMDEITATTTMAEVKDAGLNNEI
jgi:hypothetical protein